MATADVLVVGGGVSGLGFAWKAARAGRKVVVLEREPRVGGCLHSHRRPDGYWFEMGAHTAYNSYGAMLDIVVGTGIAAKVKERGPARARFGLLRGAEFRWLTPPKILLQLNWLEAAAHFPFNFLRKKDGETVYSYYSKLIGRGNYDRIFSPFFAAVPSQKADGFPVEGAGSLFKKRPRRQEFVRSFGLEGGLQTICDAVAAAPGVTVETGRARHPRRPGRCWLRRDGRGRAYLGGAGRRRRRHRRSSRRDPPRRLPRGGERDRAREDRGRRERGGGPAARAVLDAGVRVRRPGRRRVPLLRDARPVPGPPPPRLRLPLQAGRLPRGQAEADRGRAARAGRRARGARGAAPRAPLAVARARRDRRGDRSLPRRPEARRDRQLLRRPGHRGLRAPLQRGVGAGRARRTGSDARDERLPTPMPAPSSTRRAPPPLTTGAPSSSPSRAASLRGRSAPAGATKIVSSPAIVPSTSGSSARSIARAMAGALPGWVRITTSEAFDATSETRPRRVPSPSPPPAPSGSSYTVPPSGRETRRAPSWARSRESVACVASNPGGAQRVEELLLRADPARAEQADDDVAAAALVRS